MKKKTYNCISVILFVISCIALAFFFCYEYLSGGFGNDALSIAFGRGIFLTLAASALISEASFLLALRSIIFDWKYNSTFKRMLSISIIPFSFLSFLGELAYRGVILLPTDVVLLIPVICDIILLVGAGSLIYLEKKADSHPPRA